MKKILYLFLLFPLITSAQQKLTLEEALEQALKNSLDIKVAKTNNMIATISNHKGIAGGLPTVTATATNNEQFTGLKQELSNGTTTDRTGVAANNLNMNVTASMILYNGKRIITTQKRLAEIQKQTEQQINSAIMLVVSSVYLKYYAVVQQQHYIATLEKSIDVSKQKLQLIETRRSVGMANDADLFQAQLDLNAQLQSLQSQKLTIAQSKIDLLRAMTSTAQSDITIADTILIDKTIRWETIEQSLLNHPDLLVLDKQIQINQLVEKEMEARRYPTITANTGYNFVRNQSAAGLTLLNQTFGPFLGIGISVPVYTGTVNQKQIQIAKLNTDNVLTQKNLILQNNQATAYRLWQAYQTNIALLETEQQNYILSQKLLNLISQKFQLGQATIIDVKQAQQSFENAGFRLLNLTYNTKAAEIGLKQLANQLVY